jgi:hypothetical protein
MIAWSCWRSPALPTPKEFNTDEWGVPGVENGTPRADEFLRNSPRADEFLQSNKP